MGVFLYPLKILENLWFLVFSGGAERDQWHEMGRLFTMLTQKHYFCE